MTETPGRQPVPGSTVRRDLLLVVLTVTTGCADATCFLHLGQAFASVITGNLVLLGLSAAKGTGAIAANSGIALGGYAAGVLAGAPIAREHEQRGPAGSEERRVGKERRVRRPMQCLKTDRNGLLKT